jgi:hypothetical protein
MDATDLLKQMATVYAGLHSYLDQGVVVITFIDEAGRRVDRRPFCTAFQRPDRFRYQSDDESSGRLVIWQEASLAKLFWSAEPGIRSLPLALAIGSATGISGGSALTVPSLLMPSLLEGLAAPISADSPEVHPELISDVRCLRVAARQGQQPVTLWLGADDMLIRRVVQTQRFGRDQVAGLVAQLPKRLRDANEAPFSQLADFGTETETIYQPRMDVIPTEHDFEGPEASYATAARGSS